MQTKMTHFAQRRESLTETGSLSKPLKPLLQESWTQNAKKAGGFIVYVALALAIVSAIFQAVPKYYYNSVMILGTPMYTILACAVLGLGIWNTLRLLFYRDKMVAVLSGTIAWAILLSIWFALRTPPNYQNIQFDILTLGSIPVGYAIVRQLSLSRVSMFLSLLWLTMTIELIASLLLLKAGIINAAIEGDREFDISMFFSAFLAAWLLPIVVGNLVGKRKHLWAVASIFLTLGTQMAFSDMSATRNVLITFVTSIVFAIYLVLRHTSATKTVLAVLIIGPILIAIVKYADNADVSWLRMIKVRDRVSYDGFMSVDRLEEAKLMFEQLNLSLLFGRGLGGSFYSNVVTTTSPDGLATALHIGILTPLLKAGILGLFVLFIYPFFFCTKGILSKKTSLMQKGICASILVFLLQATISGGYHYSNLIVVGIVLGALAIAREADKSNSDESTIQKNSMVSNRL